MRAVVVVLAVIVAGCRGGDDGDGPSAPATSAPASAAGSEAPPRRPARKYFMVRTQARCEVYWTEGDRTSEPVVAPCPAYVEVGERIRIAGKTCLREGGARERHQPVVCPDPLTNAEKWDRQGLPWGGEGASTTVRPAVSADAGR